MSKTFALIGAAGYIAPRHMAAIKETGGELVAACDFSDSVGVLDRYFPDCEFFTSPERFERYLSKLNYYRESLDYLVVCTPNYLHDTHIRMGLNATMNIICEKPLVIKPKNAKFLLQMAADRSLKINVIQQLRLHPALKILQEIDHSLFPKCQVMVNYVAPRGRWYHRSWKGDKEKSGGLAMNIGIHIFDLLISLFGPMVRNRYIGTRTDTYCTGNLELEYANVDYLLSVNPAGKAKRELIIEPQNVNGTFIDLSKGFENLHTKSYEEILAGRGFGPSDVLPALELVNNL